MFSCVEAFVAIKADGSLHPWGYHGVRTGAPSGTGYFKVFSTDEAFVALK